MSTTTSFTAPNQYRHVPTPFHPDVDAQSPEPIIQTLLSLDSSLKLYARSSPQYASLRGVYNKLVTAEPLAICRPTTIEQVQLIVRTVSSTGGKVPLGIRCGGHDVWGRGCIADSITIDMREMDAQTLANDHESVCIGGGVTSRNLVNFLDSHGLCTANGTAGNVGWTGWAVWGGYGPLNDFVGMGVDNILSAKVVLADGTLVEAGPGSELLWGVRGAGGTFGVIVEVTVKVYRMPTILAGFIVYKWEESMQMLLGLQELLDKGVPDALCLQMGFRKTKRGMGMSLIFTWADTETIDEGRKWLDVMKQLAGVVVSTVSVTTFTAFQKSTTRVVDDPVNVFTRSVSIPRFTPETIALLVNYSEAIPDTRQYTIIAHIAHGKGTRPNDASCFGTRRPHVLFHINACDEPEHISEAQRWTDGLMKDLVGTGQTLKPVYVSFMGKDEDPRESFGENWDRLQALKKSVDKDNLFRFSQPGSGE
ncbi:FAD binding domain protein [Aspergillus sclerotialis]|uniref:FAD binding domain protein n=1 Tax=Aspergillus sclerotialis TaxID=2070753 RepID=A0A3A2Z6P0_9EURO|nr:FAD binding domain protein [Aspergillus sclerotialis]